MVRIIQHRVLNYVFSALLLAGAIYSLLTWGMKFGIDFTGGSILEVEFAATRPEILAVQESLNPLDLGSVTVQPAGQRAAIIRFRDVDEDTHQAILAKLKEVSGGEITEKRFGSIGPLIGSELQRRALWGIVVALFFIVSYIAWAFRKVSRPVASWKYGAAAVVALAHDILVVIGVFSAIGHFYGIEVDSLFVSALLTILGFSVHDTIVVFDRIRENLFRAVGGTFEDVVNKSVNDTMVRSINTSLTVLLVLTMLFLFGGESIRYFSLALIIGIAIGTYSSIFIASPLLVDWQRFSSKGSK